MKNFLLDAKPNFGEVKVTIDGLDYQLKRMKGNGCVFGVFNGGVETDEVVLTTQACKALYCLLTVKDCK
jgi:hypothetical protein